MSIKNTPDQVLELQAQVATLKAKNKALNAEIDEAQTLNLKFALSVIGLASQGWSLAKADEIRALLEPYDALLETIFNDAVSIEDDVISVLKNYAKKGQVVK